MKKIILFTITCLILKTSIAVSQEVKSMDSLISENAAVISSIIEDGVDLSVPYHVEFIAVFPTAEDAEKVAMMYVADSRVSKDFIKIETTPSTEDGVELTLIKSMIVTPQSVSEFESKLIERAKMHGGAADGWGMLSD